MAGRPGGGFHHALEALVTKRAFLTGVRAQLLQVVRRDARLQPLLVGAGAFVWVASHREIERVGREEWSRARARCVCTPDRR
jgi:hypothetical protein